MYKIIEPQAHELHDEKISSLLGLLKIYQNFYLDPEAQDRATFIIAEDDKRGVYGGTVLYPRKIPSFLEFLSEDIDDNPLDKMVSSFQPKVKEYWAARICLCLGYDLSTSLRETVELYQRFYFKLYKAFCYFGEKENINSLSFTLRASDTHVDNNLRILTWQTWPSLLEIKQSYNGFHNYFHGILSLKESALKANPFKGDLFKGNPLKGNPLKGRWHPQQANSHPSSHNNFSHDSTSAEWRAS
ncbi:MAG: hypothetical protein BGO67_03875 [Alphaproteobacteria bacterium 41-28]|nr:MAG: hypothetical protein BGO67_03875 [Alphaproteobacteria bacterium 41-28]